MNDSNQSARRWWGAYDLEIGQLGHWRIGPLSLHVHRRASEWLVAWESKGDPKEETTEIKVPTEGALPVDATVNRFPVQATNGPVTLMPRLADRPVIIKPETPLYVPGGERVTLFIGSPVWVDVAVGKPPRSLLEVEAYRTTDTWFGPNTRQGELCYASKTLARLNLEDCTVRPHRAITAVEVQNNADESLLIELLQLPAPLLALFATEENVLWTQSVTLTREDSGNQTSLKISNAPHPEGGVLTRLAEPRQAQGGNIVFQAFSKLFG